MQVQELFPGTVCCILCRGMVIYKEGEKTRFTAHMANEHGAFFDIDYLLASSLMEDEQKAAVARAVDVPDLRKDMDAAQGPTKTTGIKIKEAFTCEGCSTQFAAKTVFIQHVSKGCKKEIMKERFSCQKCEKTYSSKQKLKVHIENSHAELAGHFGMKEDILMDQPKHEEFNVDSTMEEMSFDDGPGLNSTPLQDDNDLDGGDMVNISPTEDSAITNPDVNLENVITEENTLKDSKPPKKILCVLCDKKFRTNEGLNLHIAKKHSKADKEEHSLNISLNSSNYGIDTSQSDYLTKNSTLITKARGASIHLFNQDAKGLPEGWKSRTIEAKNSSRNVETIVKKQFLSPTGIVLKTGLAVVEFLRLGGTMNMESILEVAKVLNIKEKTLKKVLGDSPMDIPQTCNVTLG